MSECHLIKCGGCFESRCHGGPERFQDLEGHIQQVLAEEVLHLCSGFELACNQHSESTNANLFAVLVHDMMIDGRKISTSRTLQTPINEKISLSIHQSLITEPKVRKSLHTQSLGHHHGVVDCRSLVL